MPGMSPEERVCIYIDGSNFYHYLKDREVAFPFNTGVRFDYKAFADYLVGDRNTISVRYYTGVFRNVDDSPKSAQLLKGQQKFLAQLENDGLTVVRGRILYDGGRPREKGTDVKIAVDLVVGAVDDLYDTALLIRSDTDLIPALRYVRYRGKKLEYVGFSHAPSFGIQKNVDFTRLLLPSDIEVFKKEG